MTKIGITGHMNLTPESVPLVDQAIREKLTSVEDVDLVGLSCLAAGSDSIFAQAVVDLGGALIVVLPSSNYRKSKVKPDHAPAFDTLIKQARTVHVMPFSQAGREAYEAANNHLLPRLINSSQSGMARRPQARAELARWSRKPIAVASPCTSSGLKARSVSSDRVRRESPDLVGRRRPDQFGDLPGLPATLVAVDVADIANPDKLGGLLSHSRGRDPSKEA